MNLAPLYEKQKELDARIVREKDLKGIDLLPMKILALQAEIGELANEWRGFKFWSQDQEPRLDYYEACDCPHCEGHDEFHPGNRSNRVLEEYVDGLHFILSIGLELDIPIIYVGKDKNQKQDIIKLFTSLFFGAGVIGRPESEDGMNYLSLVSDFIRLGQLLGFTWEEVERAYYSKNETNHIRQSEGY
jgi:dimeric dUTPase (all-alpha-NTP-PPase superfamily)